MYGQRYDASGAAVGGEFQINTSTSSAQRFPSVAMDGAGNFVVVWSSTYQDGSIWGVFGQRYDASGSAVGGEFQINTHASDSQHYPSAAMDGSGNFVVTWTSFGQDGSSWGVYGQRYDASGSAVGGEFQINTQTGGAQVYPSAAMDGAGNFVVTWASFGQDGSSYGVYGQRYDASGAAVGGEFQINTYTTGEQRDPSVAMDGAGNFIVAWMSLSQDGDNYGVFGQRYSSGFGAAALPTAGPEFLVNTTTNSSQQFAGFTGGPRDCHGCGRELRHRLVERQFKTVAAGGSFGQRYDAGGAAVGGEFQINTHTSSHQLYPSLAMDGAGNFLVTWSSLNQDGSGWGCVWPAVRRQRCGGGQRVSDQHAAPAVTRCTRRWRWTARVISSSPGRVHDQDGSSWGVYGQRYDASGTAAGSEFQINTHTSSHQQYPSVAMDGAGNFVVTWSSFNQDGSGWGVYGQRYDASGTATGSEFQINTHTSSHQLYPSVAMDGAGNFVVTWSSFDQDGDSWGVYAQRYDASGASVGSEFQINTHTSSGQVYPSVAMDGAGNFVVTWMSLNQDGSGYGVYGQQYDANGAASGNEFQINTHTSSDQRDPSR